MSLDVPEIQDQDLDFKPTDVCFSDFVSKCISVNTLVESYVFKNKTEHNSAPLMAVGACAIVTG